LEQFILEWCTNGSVSAFQGDTDRASMYIKGFDPLQPGDIADIIHLWFPDLIINIADLVVMRYSSSIIDYCQ
jgi:hypothetical protein